MTAPDPAGAGVELSWEERGEGPPVLLLHGFTGSAAAMEPVATRLAARHRVISVDLIGHGRSPVPRSAEECSLPAVLAQLEAVVAAAAAVPCHLAGYSMGGRIALALAAGRPERVASVIAVGASAGIRDEAERARRRASDAALADRIVQRGIAWFVDYWASLPILQPASAEGRAGGAGRDAQRMRNDPEALAMVLRSLGPGSVPYLGDELGRIAAPMLFVAGAADTRYVHIAAELAAMAGDGRAVAVEDAGHSVPTDNPAALAAAMLAFLESVQARAA